MGPGQQRYVNTAPLPSGIKMDKYIEMIQQNILQEMWKQVQYCLIFCFILVSTICKVSNIFQLSNFVYMKPASKRGGVTALLIKISTLSIIYDSICRKEICRVRACSGPPCTRGGVRMWASGPAVCCAPSSGRAPQETLTTSPRRVLSLSAPWSEPSPSTPGTRELGSKVGPWSEEH